MGARRKQKNTGVKFGFAQFFYEHMVSPPLFPLPPRHFTEEDDPREISKKLKTNMNIRINIVIKCR